MGVFVVRFFSFIFGVCLTAMSYAKQYPVKLGQSTVVIDVEQRGVGKAFIHVHQNERTALKAAQKVVSTEGGSILTLRHGGGRNITFMLNGQYYEFDPNRIFTETGIQKTLSMHGAYSREAHQQVKLFADTIKRLLPPGKVVAVHNNESYSLKNYLPGHDLEHDAASFYQDHEQFHRNFYLVTQEDDYERLKTLRFNSVLQALNATDDGSLSVYLAGRSYVNVEAGYDQLEQQINMLKHA